MNRLQLVQRLALEAGASGSITATASQTGEAERLVTWVDQAWDDIQRMRVQWQWMRKTAGPANLTQDQSTYAPASAPFSLTDFGYWFNGSFRIYKTTVDNEQILTQYPYERFRDTFIYGTTRSTSGYPIAITVTPAKELQVALQPDDTDYYLTGEYYASPTTLAADGDTPGMPDEFHVMIVWKALTYYGSYESSPEAYTRGMAMYTELMDDLRENQGAEFTVNRGFL